MEMRVARALNWVLKMNIPYNVRADSIAQAIDYGVRQAIMGFLRTYDFPYVTSVGNKSALREVFIEHFRTKHSLDWLKDRVYTLATSKDLRGVATVAWSETNRLHTIGLGKALLSKGKETCTTVHSYGDSPMSEECRTNLEGKILHIQDIINNSFPKTRDELSRRDIAMVPQHWNCRHVLAPVEE